MKEVGVLDKIKRLLSHNNIKVLGLFLARLWDFCAIRFYCQPQSQLDIYYLLLFIYYGDCFGFRNGLGLELRGLVLGLGLDNFKS